jgi:DNA replication and repair protein RecF
MKLKKIELLYFRNLLPQTIELNPNKNYFLGQNAQGKTNLLEAIYFLSRGKSFRPTQNESLIQFHNPHAARLTADFQHQNFDYRVRANILNSKKEFLINSKKTSSAQLQELIPVVLFSPESLAVIKESAEQRRALIDEIVVSIDPKQTKIINEFLKALRSRNALLRDLAAQTSFQEDRRMTLESLNQIYLVLATHLTQQRLMAIRRIWADFKNSVEFIFGDSKAEVGAQYLISGEVANDWDEQKIFSVLQKRMADLQLSEYGAGHSLVGPHKHDIKFLFDGNDTRFYCSQGQQRALILALKIAQIVYHHRVHQKYPILLLDDVLSELDESKRSNLMKFLGEISAQVLITATELASSEMRQAEKGDVFFVKSGKIEKSKTLEASQDSNINFEV